MPIYRIGHLSSVSVNDGTVSDGDDNVWMGSRGDIAQGQWRSLFAPSENRKQLHLPSNDSDGSSNK